MKKLIVFYLLLLFHYGIVTASQDANSKREEVMEFKARGGLPNFFSKVSHGDSVKVSYFGGSITAQEGWRVLSLEWLKSRFHAAQFAEINAAIGGTGSDFGAFRLKEHVLKYKPDLVFVEFAVNDGGSSDEKITRSMEGIVRQIWQQNPLTDICFIYTIHEAYLDTEQNGQLPAAAKIMERIAEKYNIPSINFGRRVSGLVIDKQLIMKGEGKELNGIRVFSPDGVHPYPETGHAIYLDVLKDSFETMISADKSKFQKHLLSKPLVPDNFSNAQMIDFTKGKLSENWKILQINDEPSFSGFGKYLEKFGKASQSGQTLSIRFKGTTIGAYDFMGPDAGKLVVTIDGIARDTISRFDPYCTYRRMNYFLIDHLENKIHEVVFRVLTESFDKVAILAKIGNTIKNADDYKENNWYVGKILIDGYLVP